MSATEYKAEVKNREFRFQIFGVRYEVGILFQNIFTFWTPVTVTVFCDLTVHKVCAKIRT